LPPLAIGIVEKVAFNTTYLGSLIGNRFTGGSEGTAIMEHARRMDPMMLFAPFHFFLNPGLWLGLAVTAVFLTAAIRLRRYRGPI
jgi:ABC-2 type transport system permease protein